MMEIEKQKTQSMAACIVKLSNKNKQEIPNYCHDLVLSQLSQRIYKYVMSTDPVLEVKWL